MLESFINSIIRIESLRIGVLLFLSLISALLQFFHVLPEEFFKSSVYVVVRYFLYIALILIIVYAIYKYQHKKNLDKLKKDMEELAHNDHKISETMTDSKPS
jgi:hypothetical protein